MRFVPIADGWVSRRQEGSSTAVAAGPRCAVTPTGEIVCSFMVQSELGINDFVPLLVRSHDGGMTWQEEGPLFPHLMDAYSIFGVISPGPLGDLLFFGTRYPIDLPGESFWSDANQGLKQNELFWSRSSDGGRSWAKPVVIPMPIPGSAEAPGAMCVSRSGRWLLCYAPYNTFDPQLVVDRGQVVVMWSDDEGHSWGHTSMLRFPGARSGGAEAWVVELADGRLLGASWHLDHDDRVEYPNAYALSADGGQSWSPTRSTGILGQSCALTPLPDGRALFVYNQRRHGDAGVRLALVSPTETDYGVLADELIWQAETTTQRGTSGEHSQWTDFSFGEPSVTRLPDGQLLVTLWCVQPSDRGIRYVKLRME